MEYVGWRTLSVGSSEFPTAMAADDFADDRTLIAINAESNVIEPAVEVVTERQHLRLILTVRG
ncbi:hypothetical protein C162_25980 [Paenibacillus sp. FSL R7-269]|nr:hypothetical protein C162_25980 [Paenibacillus sp. FSL R7-269]